MWISSSESKIEAVSSRRACLRCLTTVWCSGRRRCGRVCLFIAFSSSDLTTIFLFFVFLFLMFWVDDSWLLVDVVDVGGTMCVCLVLPVMLWLTAVSGGATDGINV